MEFLRAIDEIIADPFLGDNLRGELEGYNTTSKHFEI